MKNILTLLLILFVVNVFAQKKSKKNESEYIIRNVHVIPLTKDTILKNKQVTIRNGVIIEISSDLDNLFNSKTTTAIINGQGKYIVPGMMDAHAHLPGAGDPFTVDEYLKLNVKYGVTAIRNMRGKKEDLEIKKKYDSLKGPTPLHFVSSPFVWKNKNTTFKSFEDSIIKYKKEGYPFIKYLFGTDEKGYDSLYYYSLKHKLPLAGHAPKGGLSQLENKYSISVEHIESMIDLYDADSINFLKNVEKFSKNQHFICPDFYWYYITGLQTSINTKEESLKALNIDTSKLISWRKEYEVEFLKYLQKNPILLAKIIESDDAIFNKAKKVFSKLATTNIQFLISPGAGPYIFPGYSMMNEMELFKNMGFSNYLILKYACLNPYKFLQLDKEYGTLEPGKKANFLLLNENPLTDIKNMHKIEGVFIHNEYFKISTEGELIKLF